MTITSNGIYVLVINAQCLRSFNLHKTIAICSVIIPTYV